MITRDDGAAAALLGFVFDAPIVAPFAGFVLSNGRFATGALVLNGHDGTNVNMTVASKRPMSVRDAREIARMCFVGLGCVRVTARTRMSNAKARRGLEAVGFRQEGVARLHFGDEDAALYGLLRREQKLIRID